MAEQPIGQAFVEIRPDLKGFETLLRTGVSAVIKKVTAPVKVTPNLAGFQAALKAGVAASTTTPVAVPVVPNFVGFETALRAGATAATARPIKVEVAPNLLRFQAALRTGVTPVKVPVVPGLAKFDASIRAGIAAGTLEPVVIPVIPGLAGFHTAIRAGVAAETVTPILVPIIPNTRVFQTLLLEEIATQTVPPILVLVLPNLAGFEAALRFGVASKSVKPVKVPIIPSLTGFQLALREQTTALNTKPIPVSFVPNLTGFQAALRAELHSAKVKPIPVPLVPSLTGFQAALRFSLATLKITPVRVPVVPATVGFHSTVRAEIAAEQVKPVTIPVAPNLKGFQAALRTEVAATNLKPVPVTVVPTLTGFQTALRVEFAKKTITPLPVPVRPVLTSNFVADLRAQIAKRALAPIPVPVTTRAITPLPPISGGADLAGSAAVLAGTTTATKTATRATEDLGKAWGRGGKAARAFGTSTKDVKKNLSEVDIVTGRFASNTQRFSRGIAATGLSLFGLRGATLAATGAFLAGAAGVTAIAKAVAFATSFNSQLAVFAATTGATAVQMRQVSDAAKSLGRDLSLPGVTAIDAAQAMTELAKAGLSVNDAIDGTRGVLQLAKAAAIDNAEAVQLAASALNAFELAGSRASVVADTLANAANQAQGSIVDVGIAFQQAAAIGHQVGLTFQDTTLFVTQLARAGLTGSDAGTSLRTALIRLINPSKKAAEIFKNLGIEVRDAQGNVRPDFFVNLGAALQGMSAKQRDATLAIIGGQDAVRALSILSRGSTKDLIRLRNELAKQGTASDVAKARLTGLAGAGANLSNTVEGIALSLGQKATPSLIGFTNSLTNTVQAVASSPLVTGTLADSIHTVADAFGLLGTVIAGIAPALQAVGGGVNAVTGLFNPTAVIAFTVALLSARKVMATVVATQKALAVTSAANSIIPTVNIVTRSVAAFSRVRIAMTELGTAAVIALSSFRNFGLGIRAVALSLTAFAATPAGIAIGIAAAVGALVFFTTRASAAEKGARRLKDAFRDLADVTADVAAKTDQLARAQTSVQTDQLAVQSAHLAVQQARVALAVSDAGKNTLARKQLESQLAISINNVTLAQQQLNSDLKAAADLHLLLDEAEKERRSGIQETIADLQSQIAVEVQRNTLVAGTKQGNVQPEQKEAIARKTIIQLLHDQADEQAKLKTVEGIHNAQTLRVLAAIVPRLKEVSQIQPLIRLALDSKSVDAGLAKVQKELSDTGEPAAAKMVEGLRKAVSAGKLDAALVAPLLAVLRTIPGLFQHAATDSTDKFSEFLDRGLADAFKRARDQAEAGVASIRATIFAGVTALSNQTDTLFGQLQDIQIGGGSLDEQLAKAREAQTRANRERARADAALAKTPRGEKEQEAVKTARAHQAQAQSEIDRITSEQDAKSKAAAAAHKDAVDKIADDRKKADQRFLDAVSFRRGNLDLALQRAQATVNNVADDIKAQEAISAELRRDRAAALKAIHDVQLRKETIQSFDQALEQSNQALADLRTTQIKNKFALAQTKAESTETLADDLSVSVALGNALRKAIDAAKKTIADVRERTLVTNALSAALKIQQAATEALRKQFVVQQRDREQEKLDLDVQIAEAQGNKGKELRAHQRLLAFLIQRRKHTDAGTLAYKQLTLQIEQQRAAIRELNKAQTDLNNAGASLAFSILQTQAGFASTILSNLLPKGSVAGAVGGTATGISTPTGPFIPPADFATGVHKRPHPGSTGSGIRDTFGPRQPLTVGVGAEGAGGPSRPPDIRDLGTGLTRTTAGAGAPTPPTSGQLMTLIHIAKLQLHAIQKLAGQHTHPESKTSRATQPVDYGGHT